MAYLGDTGQGATAVFTLAGAIAKIRTMQLPSFVSEAIDASILADGGFINKIPGDVTDAGDCTMVLVFDATAELPVNNVVDNLVITFPIGQAPNTVGGTLTGDGFLTTVGLPNMALNTLMEMELIFTYNGAYSEADGPVFTPEQAP